SVGGENESGRLPHRPGRRAESEWTRHLRQARQPHLAKELSGMPSSGADWPDVAVELQGRCGLVGHYPRSNLRGAYATLARRSALRQVQQRPPTIEGGP